MYSCKVGANVGPYKKLHQNKLRLGQLLTFTHTDPLVLSDYSWDIYRLPYYAEACMETRGSCLCERVDPVRALGVGFRGMS